VKLEKIIVQITVKIVLISTFKLFEHKVEFTL